MIARVFRFAVLCFGVTVVLGCGGKSEEPDPNGESHWLMSCTNDAECAGSGSCFCGRCTVACQSDGQCAGVPVRTSCVFDWSCAPSVGFGACLEAPVDAGTDASADAGREATPDVSADAAKPDVSADACVIPPCPPPGVFDPDTCRCVAADAGHPADGADVRDVVDLPDVANPTGTCVAPNDGSRPGYPVVGSARWLPDCKNPLKREYWRVFAESGTSAYILPRPDGAVELTMPCGNPNHPLAAVVERYKLCSQAATPADIDTVNHIDPAAALAIAHYMHAELSFAIGSRGGLFPTPMTTDVVDACALHPELASADLTSVCNRQRADIDAGLVWPEDGGTAVTGLQTRLNELYGIAQEPDPDANCIERTEHASPVVLNGIRFGSLGFSTCLPTCSPPGPRWPYTSDALPAGACEPGWAPCQLAAQGICSCGGGTTGIGAVNLYHCACVDQRWECFQAVAGASPCACVDAGAGDADAGE
jgi:hypothetical protein